MSAVIGERDAALAQVSPCCFLAASLLLVTGECPVFLQSIELGDKLPHTQSRSQNYFGEVGLLSRGALERLPAALQNNNERQCWGNGADFGRYEMEGNKLQTSKDEIKIQYDLDKFQAGDREKKMKLRPDEREGGSWGRVTVQVRMM